MKISNTIKSPLLKAINPKNQSLVNKAINWEIKYNKFNDLRDLADGDADEKAYKKWDNKCQSSFDKALEIIDELPMGQQQAIENFMNNTYDNNFILNTL